MKKIKNIYEIIYYLSIYGGCRLIEDNEGIKLIETKEELKFLKTLRNKKELEKNINLLENKIKTEKIFKQNRKLN